MSEKMKFCKHCGEQIDDECVVCPKCGKQVEKLESGHESIIINNNVSSSASASAAAAASAASSSPGYVYVGKPKNKWISLVLCICTICGHKFYEGKIGMGFLYLFTGGLFFIGWIIDIISLIGKPNPYYV